MKQKIKKMEEKREKNESRVKKSKYLNARINYIAREGYACNYG